MSNITIQKIGITQLDTDCIVNAANEKLAHGSGVSGAIFEAAGEEKLQCACNVIGGCPTGNAVITPGFGLKAKYIIHAVGPIWTGGTHNEPQELNSCYMESLKLAKENDCHTIGFPLISSGIFGYPKDKAWRVALEACDLFLRLNSDYNIDIIFAVLDDDTLRIGEETLRVVRRSVTVSDRLNLVGFFDPNNPNGYMSNFYLADFVIDGITFSCVEQYMMYRKAMLFGDIIHAKEILGTVEPQEIKALGRKVENYNDTIWNGVRQLIVYEALEAKFGQNPDLMEKLLATGDATIAECSPTDRVWGIRKSTDDSDRFYMDRWEGTNYLGFALMHLRERVRLESSDI